MAKFMIEMPHTKEQCMSMMGKMAMEDAPLLKEAWWGCMDGNHTGWVMVDAASKDEAAMKVPEQMRGEAKVTEIMQFSAEELKEKMMSHAA